MICTGRTTSRLKVRLGSGTLEQSGKSRRYEALELEEPTITVDNLTKQVSPTTLSHEQNAGTERVISGDRIGARIARQQKVPSHIFFP